MARARCLRIFVFSRDTIGRKSSFIVVVFIGELEIILYEPMASVVVKVWEYGEK